MKKPEVVVEITKRGLRIEETYTISDLYKGFIVNIPAEAQILDLKLGSFNSVTSKPEIIDATLKRWLARDEELLGEF